jgi:transposase
MPGPARPVFLYPRSGRKKFSLLGHLDGRTWRMLPEDFPPFTTVQGYFYDWCDNGLFKTINFHLLLQAREAAGRDANPSAGVIDSQ